MSLMYITVCDEPDYRGRVGSRREEEKDYLVNGPNGAFIHRCQCQLILLKLSLDSSTLAKVLHTKMGRGRT